MSEIKLALNDIAVPSFTKPKIIEKVQNLPKHIQALSSQVAGHEFAIFKDQQTGHVMKPVFDERGVREEVFYRLLFDPKYDQNPTLAKLRSFLPNYISTQVINEVMFVTLSDLTLNVVNPSLMDVKIGTITYDRLATKEKIKNESTKDTVSRAMGFRVLAIKKWIEAKSGYEQIERDFCRTCTAKEEANLISFYLKQQDKARTIQLAKEMLSQLTEIKNWFERDNIDLFEFIGSSVLFIYSFHKNQLDCRAKIIDFAHTYQLEGSKVNKSDDKKDHNYLYGLNALMKLIEQYLLELEC